MRELFSLYLHFDIQSEHKNIRWYLSTDLRNTAPVSIIMKVFTAKQLRLGPKAFFLVLMFAFRVFSASSDVDPSFDPDLKIALAGGYGSNVAIQPDGKILIFGSYSINGGLSPRPFFKRLNADGTVDTTFRCPACVLAFPRSVAVQADGKILIGNSTETLGGLGGIVRVNPNGSLDTSFRAALNSCVPHNVVSQPDGKSLIKCNSIFPNGDPEFVRRLNDNGSADTTFATIVMTTSPGLQYVNEIVLLSDGKILIGGGYTSGSSGGWLNRYNTNGTVDNSFQVTANSRIEGVDLLPDGKILIVGTFSVINGTSRSKIAKLASDGSLDSFFAAAASGDPILTGVRSLSNGQFYVLLYTGFSPGPLTYRFVRYNADGSIDNTFSQTFNSGAPWAVDDSNRILTFKGTGSAARYYRLNIDGNIDTSFNPIVSVEGWVTAAALQPDGKVIIAGEFTKLNGVDTVSFARLNFDGTTDATFNAGSGFDDPPDTLAVQPDGKILASGDFTVYNGTARTKIVRINADGSLDAPFSPNISSDVYAIQPLPGGKILIGGSFTTVNGTTQAALARLNADGSLDTSFNLVLTGSPHVLTVLLQSDGKIMVGGTFSVSGSTTKGLARLNSDGSLDSSFSANTARINQVFQRPDGKYVTSSKDIGFNNPSVLGRFNNNGTTDFSFRSQTENIINSIFLQPNGNILFGGKFPRYIDRVGPSGEEDIFFPTFGTNNVVSKIIGQPDGKIIFAGMFSGIEDVPRSGIARLTLSNRVRGTLFDYDGDGRADVSVFRPSTNTWYELFSGTWTVGIQNFGIPGDIPAPADYDADGKTDLTLFRPSIGDWLHLLSSTNTVTQVHWGQAGDIPRPSDADANGSAEITLYRPSTGIWYRFPNSSVPFGSPGDQPLVGDFDGDGKYDPAVFRPSTGDWWYAASTEFGAHRSVHWGASGDIPVPADYDGDFKTDFAVYRPSEGGWYIFKSSDGGFITTAFGLPTDRPTAADYDGDGKADIAVYRPSTGIWYLLQTTAGSGGLQFGLPEDIPTESAFIP